MTANVRILGRLSFPLAIASTANAVETAVCTLCLAHASDAELLAALPASSFAAIFTAVATAFLGYAGTIMASHYGKGQTHLVLQSFIQSIWLFVATLPLFILVGVLAHPTFSLFGHTPELVTAECKYLNYLLITGAIRTFAVVLMGFFNGRGQTHFSGTVMVMGTGINIALTPYLVLNHQLGIVGAGLSRVISASLPLVILIWGVWRHTRISGICFNPDIWRFRPQQTWAIISKATPNALAMLVDYGAFFLLTAFISALDPKSAAASTIVFILTNFYFAFVRGLSHGVELLVAQQKDTRGATRSILRAAHILAYSTLAVFLVVLWFGLDESITLFSSNTTKIGIRELQTAVISLIPILIIRELIETPQQLLMGALRGLGQTASLLRIQSIAIGLIFIPLMLVIRALHPTVEAYWLAMPAYMTAASLLLMRKIRN